jgi:hypothetical protein
MILGGLGMESNSIITMQLITVTNGDRFCHSFVYHNQSTWKNFDSFGSEHELIRSEHELIHLDRHGGLIASHRNYVELLRVLADARVQSVTLITSRDRLSKKDN